MLVVKVQEGTTEGKCVAGQVLTRAKAKKSDKIHPLKVKAVCHRRLDSTLKRYFDRVAKLIIRENHVGEFFMKNGLIYRKHQETKMGRSSNQLVVPKGL